VFLEQGIFMCLYVLFHSATSLSPVFLEPGVFMCLYVLFHSAFVINRLPGTLLLMRCEFPIYNSYVSGHVHLTDRTNWSNRQRWTAGSVVNNEMWFSDWQRPGFGSCPLVHLTNQTNRSNWQHWTAGSVVSDGMHFSNWQHQGFGSCPFDESDELIDPTGFIASLQLMRCNFPIDNE